MVSVPSSGHTGRAPDVYSGCHVKSHGPNWAVGNHEPSASETVAVADDTIVPGNTDTTVGLEHRRTRPLTADTPARVPPVTPANWATIVSFDVR